jgi:hypothetical protein
LLRGAVYLSLETIASRHLGRKPSIRTYHNLQASGSLIVSLAAIDAALART